MVFWLIDRGQVHVPAGSGDRMLEQDSLRAREEGFATSSPRLPQDTIIGTHKLLLLFSAILNTSQDLGSGKSKVRKI